MRVGRAAVALMLIALIASPAAALAQEAEGAKRDYVVYCSSCHGTDARGHGPALEVIPGFKPADLTSLSKTHQGKFPEEEVRQVIDGRKALPGHNDWDTDMPLFGLQFQEEGKQFSPASESKVQRRIDALVAYIRSIQRD